MKLQNHLRLPSTKYKGQTLVEVIVALAFFSLAATAFLAVTVYSLNNATFTRQKNDATNLARKRIEEIRKVRDVQGFQYIQDQKEFLAPSTTFHRINTSSWTLDCSAVASTGCPTNEVVNGVSFTSTIQLTCGLADGTGCDSATSYANSYFDVQTQVQWTVKGSQKTVTLNDRLAKI